MRTVQLPDEIVTGLEAVAALDQCTVTELAAGALVDLLADRYHAIQVAYVALREIDPDNGRPTTSAAPVSSNGHGSPPTPAAPKKKPAKKAKRQAGKKTCQRQRCDDPVKARGMCRRHYNRWYAGKDATAPDGTRSPAAHQDTQEGAPDPDPAPRTSDVDEGGRQDAQPEAGDGPPSSTSTPDPRRGEVDPDDPSCCTAARCRSAKETDGDFCPTHRAIFTRMVAKLRAEFGGDARDEAADRLVAGVR